MENKKYSLKTILRVLFNICLTIIIVGSITNVLAHYGIILSRYCFGGLFAMVVSSYVVIYFIFTMLTQEKISKCSETEKVYHLHSFLNITSLGTVIIAILACITAVLIIPYKAEGTADVQTITNFYTAFIALCTTFVVGFQIYNSIDLNKRINRVEDERMVLEKRIEELKKTTLKSNYFNAYTIGTIRYNETQLNKKDEKTQKRYCWNAIRTYFNALKYAARGGHDFGDAMLSFGYKIENCISELNSIHEENNKEHIEPERDDKESIMPSISDRHNYIYETCGYITATRKIIESVDTIDFGYCGEYMRIVNLWMTFIERYYPYCLHRST